MTLIKTLSKENLLMKAVDLVSKTYIELGQNNVEEDTIMIMSQSLAEDLSKIYKNFYFEDAEKAFNLGVRSPMANDFIHLNVPTYMKWLRKYRDLIWDARSRVDKGENPKEVPHYRPEPKLIK
jgi:hypothetical protein|tara:strand:- start:1855 stop:2223 length:369 start_codon:yes stop_codon:yes gene_type:complete